MFSYLVIQMNKIVELKNELIESLSVLYTEDIIARLSSTLEGESSVLLCLNKYDEPITPTMVSQDLHITKARVTAIVSSLLEKDLVVEERNKVDRRKICLSLSPKGRTLVDDRLVNINKQVTKILEKLGEEKTLQLIELISDISNIILEVKEESANERL